MSESRDCFSGAFDGVEPDDFTEAATLAAKLAPLNGAFTRGIFDLEEFVDRCVRRTEAMVTEGPIEQFPLAFLACDGRDLEVRIHEGEPLLEFLDRLHEEVVQMQAAAAFLVKSVDHGWAPGHLDGAAHKPALYFYSESRAGAVIHGFWRVTGRGMTARLTECYKIRGAEPNRIMHRMIAGGD